jgi:hypothetical protein
VVLRLVAYWRGWRLPLGLEWQPSRIVRRGAAVGAEDRDSRE